MADRADRPAGRGRPRTLRARLTLITTSLVAVVLVVGAVVLFGALRAALEGSLDDSARQRALDVAGLVDTGRLPDPVPVTGGTAAIQVVSADGRVRAASPGGDHVVPLLAGAALGRVRGGAAVSLDGARIGGTDRLRVVGVRASGGDTVLVAVSLADLQATLRVVALSLLVAVPLLLIGFAIACWLLVGSALRPVEELRASAVALGGRGEPLPSGGRLPVPAAEDEIRRLALTLNAMLDRLGEVSRRQQRFTSDAAHELRSPLASMQTQLEVALHGRVETDWPAVAADVVEDVQRLSRTVDDLLLLARLDASRTAPAPRRQRVDLVGLADAVAARTDTRIPVRRSGSAVGPVLGDADALIRAITNLVDNAVRHARQQVCVDVQHDDGTVTVTVSDDGDGIPDHLRERMFDRFTRHDDARARDSGGTGLGLAIVREIARAHDGVVDLQNASPGLRATLRLPAAP